jgi:capsular polysaccharide biosynthesis protein
MSQTETEAHTPAHTSLDDLPLIDPAPPNVGAAVRRHPIILVVSVLICVAIAAAVGLVRKPSYTANAKLQVGSINLTLPGAIGNLPNIDAALATSYSRQIQAAPIISTVAKRLHLSELTVVGDLSSSPVPLSGDFTVTGASKSENEAIRVANGAGAALVTYIAGLNNNSGRVKQLWSQLKAAASQVAAAKIQVLVTHTAIERAQAKGGLPTTKELNAYAAAQAAQDTATTNEQELHQSYSAARSQQSNVPQVIAPALGATSDKLTKLAILLVGGLVAGLILGTALAMMRARRKASRLLR